MTERAHDSRRTPWEDLECFWKSAANMVTSVGAICAAFLGLVAFLGDIHQFFWSLVLIGVLAGTTTVFFFFKKRRSVIAASTSDLLVPQFGRVVRYGTATFTALSVAGVALMVVFYSSMIFDPVSLVEGGSAIVLEERGKHELLFSHVATATALVGEDRLPLVQQDHASRATKWSLPYTNQFDLIKQGRFKWVKIESVSVTILSVRPVPKEISVRMEEKVLFREGLEFRANVSEQAAGQQPSSVNATLLTSHHPVTGRGSILIEDNRPVTFFVDIRFEKEGIYELRSQVMASTGWRRLALTPKTVKVVFLRSRADADSVRPAPTFPGSPSGPPVVVPKPSTPAR